MASVFDAAAFILQKSGSMSHMKLQKLLYYSQAWSLVWEEKPIFADRIEAWVNGPVIPYLYKHLQGKFTILSEHFAKCGDPNALSAIEQDVISRVISFYGVHNPQWLSDLTHMEKPWQDARKGCLPGQRSDAEITHASMSEYYGSL
jgi:uncharacterized phage-associated protein